MKILGLMAAMIVITACNSSEPTATSYKQQLSSPAAATGTGTGTGNATGAAGDPAKGKAALTASCDVCHASGSPGHKLAAADADKISDGTAAKNPNHAGIAAAFTSSAKDIAAFLKGGTPAPAAGGAGAKPAGDAAAGAALLKAKCEACHNDNGMGVGPRLDSTITALAPKASVTASHAGLEENFSGANEANILAELKNRAP